VCLVLVTVTWAAAADVGTKAPAEARAVAKLKPQTMCPVMEGKINKRLYADHGGKRVYFCCQGCIKTFKKDPEKYIKQIEAEGITLDKTPIIPQTRCPIDGVKIDKKQHYVDHKGKRVYACSTGCAELVKKDPAKHVKELEKYGITLDKSPVVLCQKCGEIKGSTKCRKIEGRIKCEKCGLLKGSVGCCKIPKDAKAPVTLCATCGEIKGSAKCCKIEGRTKCEKCGLLKGSVGCCKLPK